MQITGIIKRLIYTEEILLAIFDFFYKDLKNNKTSELKIIFRTKSGSTKESATFKLSSNNKNEIIHFSKSITYYLDRELISEIKLCYYRQFERVSAHIDIRLEDEINLISENSSISLESENENWLNNSFIELDKILMQAVKKNYYLLLFLISLISLPHFILLFGSLYFYISCFLPNKKLLPKIKFHLGKNYQCYLRDRKISGLFF